MEKLFVEGSRSAIFEQTQETLCGEWREIYYLDLVSRVSCLVVTRPTREKLDVSEN